MLVCDRNSTSFGPICCLSIKIEAAAANTLSSSGPAKINISIVADVVADDVCDDCDDCGDRDCGDGGGGVVPATVDDVTNSHACRRSKFVACKVDSAWDRGKPMFTMSSIALCQVIGCGTVERVYEGVRRWRGCMRGWDGGEGV